MKWFEMIQTGLPGTALSAFVGPLMLSVPDLIKLNTNLLPKVI